MEKMLHRLQEMAARCRAMADECECLIADVLDRTPAAPLCYMMLVAGRCSQLSLHALERYRERTGSKQTDEQLRKRIAERIGQATEVRLKARFLVVEMLAHGQHARYWNHGGMIFVVEQEMVVTVHEGTAGRWEACPIENSPDKPADTL